MNDKIHKASDYATEAEFIAASQTEWKPATTPSVHVWTPSESEVKNK